MGTAPAVDRPAVQRKKRKPRKKNIRKEVIDNAKEEVKHDDETETPENENEQKEKMVDVELKNEASKKNGSKNVQAAEQKEDGCCIIS